MQLSTADLPLDNRGSSRQRRALLSTAALALTLLACHSLAQPSDSEAAAVSLDLSAYRVVVEVGEGGPSEALVPALSAAPGDLIEWRLVALNRSGASLAGLMLDLPVPATAAYLEGSAAASLVVSGSEPIALDPAQLSFSADGGVTFSAAPLTREIVATTDGESTTTLVTVPPSEYTHVRLALASFGPDHTYVLTLRAEVR